MWCMVPSSPPQDLTVEGETLSLHCTIQLLYMSTNYISVYSVYSLLNGMYKVSVAEQMYGQHRFIPGSAAYLLFLTTPLRLHIKLVC